MTPEEFKNKISEISQATNDNEYVMNALKELNEAFIDVSGAPSYAKTDVYDDDEITWKEKYINMKEKYREAFFNGAPVKNDSNSQTLESDMQATTITINDLFR